MQGWAPWSDDAERRVCERPYLSGQVDVQQRKGRLLKCNRARLRGQNHPSRLWSRRWREVRGRESWVTLRVEGGLRTLGWLGEKMFLSCRDRR